MRRLGGLAVVCGLLAVSGQAQESAPAPSSAESAATESAGLVLSEAGGEGPAPDAAEVLVSANRRYGEGDYAGAVELYRSLVSRGFDDGHLHYNLGNAYLRQGELGLAIASYRRSQRRLPRDEDVAANLTFARRSARDAIAPPEPPAFATTLLFWHYGLSPRELMMATLLLNLAFWGGWSLRLLRRDSEVLRWTVAALLVVLVAAAGSLFVHLLLPRHVAVVVPQEIDAHTAPDPESVVRFKLHAGTEVAVRDRRDGWSRIALPEGQQAWVQEEWVELVTAP